MWPKPWELFEPRSVDDVKGGSELDLYEILYLATHTMSNLEGYFDDPFAEESNGSSDYDYISSTAAAARSDLQMKRACEQHDVAVAAQCHRDTARVLAQLEGFAG